VVFFCSKAFLISWLLLSIGLVQEHKFSKDRLLYERDLADSSTVAGWVIEGPGVTRFEKGWMHLYSPDKKWDHVMWCPEQFPSRFIAEWQVQNMDPSEGLLIVFFAATGLRGEDIFDAGLPPRDGTFRNYTKEELKSYHISYYTNNPKNRQRELSHLRKNNMFALVQTGEEGIPKNSTGVHNVRLIKDDGHILFFVDDRKIIDWRDDGDEYGQVLGAGKIGFRQMRWSHFRYRNFKVWSIR